MRIAVVILILTTWLNLGFSQNDNCVNAETLYSGIAAEFTTTIGTETELDEISNPKMSCDAAESSVWFRYTSLEDEILSIDFTNSTIPSDAIPSLNIIDACLSGSIIYSTNSFENFNICIEKGVTIYIQIATCDNQTGNFGLIINSNAGSCNCLSVETKPFKDLCNEGGAIILEDYQITNEPGSWSISPSTIDISSGILDATDANAGTYYLKYTIDNQLDNCIDYSIQTLTILEPKFAGIPSPYFICLSEQKTIDLFSLLEDPDEGGKWTSNTIEGFNSTNGTFNIISKEAKTYSFTYEFENSEPCPQTSATIVITLYANPIADAGDNQYIDCDTPEATLDGSKSSSGNYSYNWYDNQDYLIDSTSNIITVTTANEYTLKVTNLATGCFSESTMTVTSSDEKPSFDVIQHNPICHADSNGYLGIINVQGGDENYEYKISPNQYSSLSSWDMLPAGYYTLSVIDGNGCETSIEKVLKSPQPISMNISPASHYIDIGDQEYLNINTNLNLSDIEILWTSNEEEICHSIYNNTCESIIISPTDTITTYRLMITTKNGCVISDSIDITIRNNNVYIPNIFNPNQDDEASHFFISDNQGIKNIIEFSVFSRWGERVFHTQNIQPNYMNYLLGWDGRFKGKQVDPDVYIYSIKVIFDDATKRTFTGDITVVR